MQRVNELQELYHSYLKRMQGVRDELAAQGAIVKDEPHAGLFIWATRELNAARDRQALLILLEIANHADEFGWCFPSIQRLGRLTGYDHAPGSTVECAVSRLMAKDWLRVKATRNVRRRRTETDFVLSPAVLYIRQELREDAWQRYQSVPFRNNWGDLVTNLTKPDTEPASATIYTNQIHKPDTEPPPSSSRKGGAKPSGVEPHDAQASHPLTTRNQNTQTLHTMTPDEQKTSVSNSSAQRNNDVPHSSAVHSPPGSAAPPPHPQLPEGFDAAQPLPDARDEAAAQDIYRRMHNLQLRYARTYIARYNRDTVLAAAAVAIASPHVRNPVGKMDSDLRKNRIDPADYDPLLGRKPREYDDFFER